MALDVDVTLYVVAALEKTVHEVVPLDESEALDAIAHIDVTPATRTNLFGDCLDTLDDFQEMLDDVY